MPTEVKVVHGWKVENLDGEGRSVISTQIFLDVSAEMKKNPFLMISSISLLKITDPMGEVIYAKQVDVETNQEEAMRKKALAKLTYEEKRLLGLI